MCTCISHRAASEQAWRWQNHDNEPNITHLEEIRREQLIAPLSYTRTAPPGIGGEQGPGTYWVPVRPIRLPVHKDDFRLTFAPTRSMSTLQVRLDQTRLDTHSIRQQTPHPSSYSGSSTHEARLVPSRSHYRISFQKS